MEEVKPDDELEAVLRQWAYESQYEDLRREWEEEQRQAEPRDTFRTLCGLVALVLILAWLVGCQATPNKVAKAVPALPKDLVLVCFKGAWTVYSESARQGATFNHAPCGRDAI